MLKTSKVKKCESFLSLFGKNKIVVTSDSRKANSSFTPTTVQSAILNNEKNYHDAYFYVNSGGTKQNEMTYINACFVDLDSGRDASGKYLRPSIVTKKKVAMLNAISKCPIQPTVRVETRNGYQLYWVLTKPVSVSLHKNSWDILQNKICNHFMAVGSDSRVLKVNQVMRLPHTLWHKRYEGTSDSYLTSVSSVGKKYTFNSIATAFKAENSNKPTTNSWSERKKAEKTLRGPCQSADLGQSVIQKFTKSIQKSVEPTPVAGYNNTVTQETADFLRAVNKILYYGNHKFLANQALRLASELETQSTLNVGN